MKKVYNSKRSLARRLSEALASGETVIFRTREGMGTRGEIGSFADLNSVVSAARRNHSHLEIWSWDGAGNHEKLFSRDYFTRNRTKRGDRRRF